MTIQRQPAVAVGCDGRLRWVVALVGSWLWISCSGTVGVPPPTFNPVAGAGDDGGCVLERWEDGDTAFVDCGGDAQEVVRLVGIDTAESGFDENSRKRAQWQAELWKLSVNQVLTCGLAATVRVKEICPEGSPVTLVGDDTDKYDRRLAYVKCAGQNINQRLIEEGHAGRYPYPQDPEKPTKCR